ncbi:MAG: choice-of-anchor Q domain-containing protein [Planctomycetota bacterium]
MGFGGEAAGGTIRMPITSYSFTEKQEPEKNVFSRAGDGKGAFGIDERVPSHNSTTLEINPTLVSNSDRDMWLAFENHNFTPHRISIYWSNDGGENWQFLAHIANKLFDLKEPSIDLITDHDHYVILTYIVDDGQMPYPEVAMAPLYTSTFSFHSIPVWPWEGYAKPVIWINTINGNAYLTCEGIYDSAVENINVCFWTRPYYEDWGDATVLFGNFDDEAWVDPDGSYGTDDKRNFLTCFNKDEGRLYFVRTEDNVGDWLQANAIHQLIVPPNHPVDPEVEAANYYDNVLICCTKSHNGNDDIGTTWSDDGGDTWTALNSMDGSTKLDEFAPALDRTDWWDGNWHLAFTSDHGCYYSAAPQNLGSYFQPTPDRVDDEGAVSEVYSKKGITGIRSMVPGIAWADSRDSKFDCDTYFDHTDDPYRVYVPEDYTSIQEGIDAAGDHDFVHVNQGTYYENIVIDSKTVRVRSVYGPDSTHIDGNRIGSVVSLLKCNHAYIEGFTIRNGYASSGGGVYSNGAVQCRIFDNIIRDNEALYFGGGIYYTNDSSGWIARNLILENTSTGTKGGGICSISSSPDLDNNVIVKNMTNGDGGAIYCGDSHSSLINNTVTDNEALGKGGGLYVKGPEIPSIRNGIFWGNTASSDPEIYEQSGTLWLDFSDVKGGFPSASYCIDADPLFADPANNDYQLTRYSPCIDVGANTAAHDDMLRQHRPQNGSSDMGAYEYMGPYSLSADRFDILDDEQTVVNLSLDAGAVNNSRPYMIFGGVSYSAPGTPLPNGDKFLPINWDVFTDIVLQLVNTPIFVNFSGNLNTLGKATAKIDSLGPLPSGSSGYNLFFAYACPYQEPDGWFASNPIRIEID